MPQTDEPQSITRSFTLHVNFNECQQKHAGVGDSQLMRFLGITIIPRFKTVNNKGRVIYYQVRVAGYIQGGGGRNFFLVMYWGGVENKNPLGQGGSYISSGIWGGSDVFHWFLLSLKVKASGGPSPPDPPYPK